MMKNKIVKLLLFCLSLIIFSCDKKEKIEKEVAEVRNKEYRSITVINETPEKLIKECNLTTANGVVVAHSKENYVENIVFKNFDENKSFQSESNFKITLIDRFDLRYEKTFTVNDKGNTDIIVNEDDYTPRKGDWKKRFERKLNK